MTATKAEMSAKKHNLKPKGVNVMFIGFDCDFRLSWREITETIVN